MLYVLVLLTLTNVYFTCGNTVDYRGSTYELITVRKMHSEARQACQNRDMDLAVITDEDENTFVSGLISSQPSPQDTWIGLYKTADDHSTLRWVDDTPFVLNDPAYYQPWWDDEPDNPVSRGVRMRSRIADWADQHETFQYWAICEKRITTNKPDSGTDLYYIYYNTPMTFTFIMTFKAITVTHCVLKCNLATGCFVVKVTSSDDVTGEVQCDLYKEDDGNTSVTITDFYIKL